MGVGRQSVTLRADYSLLTDLREFQAEYLGNCPPRVRVQLNAKLVKMPQPTILVTETFEFLEPATSSDLEAVVSALDVALGNHEMDCRLDTKVGATAMAACTQLIRSAPLRPP
jgi:cholesterol transport system auxiliary component